MIPYSFSPPTLVSTNTNDERYGRNPPLIHAPPPQAPPPHAPPPHAPR